MVRTIELGPASLGFPLNGATLVGARLAFSSRNLVPPRLGVLDLDTGVARNGPVVPTGSGAWAMTTVGDQVVLAQSNPAPGDIVVFRYDPASGGLVPLAPLAVDYTWSLATLSATEVVAVTGRPTRVVAVDIRSGGVRDVGIARPDDGLRSVAVAGGRVLVGGARNGRTLLLAGTGTGGDVRSVLPPALERPGPVYALGVGAGAVGVAAADGLGLLDASTLAVLRTGELPGEETLVDTVAVSDQALWATARPSGGLYRLDRTTGAVRLVSVPLPGSETRALFVRGRDVIGVGAAERVWIWRADRQVLEVYDLLGRGITPAPEQAQSLSHGGGTIAVGGNFGLQVRPARGGPFRRHFVAGEPKDQIVVNGTRYLALYPVGELWAGPADLDTAPARVARFPAEQTRPVCLAWDRRTDVILCGTAATAGGGALILFRPGAGIVGVRTDLLGPGEFVSRISAGEGVAYVAGGAGSPTMAALDLRTGAVRWRLPLGNAISTVTGLVQVGRRLHGLTQDGWAFVVDLDAVTVVRRERIGTSGGRLIRHRLRLSGVDRSELFDLEPRSGRRTAVLAGLDPVVWGNPFLDGDGRSVRFVIRRTTLLRVEETGWSF